MTVEGPFGPTETLAITNDTAIQLNRAVKYFVGMLRECVVSEFVQDAVRRNSAAQDGPAKVFAAVLLVMADALGVTKYHFWPVNSTKYLAVLDKEFEIINEANASFWMGMSQAMHDILAIFPERARDTTKHRFLRFLETFFILAALRNTLRGEPIGEFQIDPGCVRVTSVHWLSTFDRTLAVRPLRNIQEDLTNERIERKIASLRQDCIEDGAVVRSFVRILME